MNVLIVGANRAQFNFLANAIFSNMRDIDEVLWGQELHEQETLANVGIFLDIICDQTKLSPEELSYQGWYVHLFDAWKETTPNDIPKAPLWINGTCQQIADFALGRIFKQNRQVCVVVPKDYERYKNSIRHACIEYGSVASLPDVHIFTTSSLKDDCANAIMEAADAKAIFVLNHYDTDPILKGFVDHLRNLGMQLSFVALDDFLAGLYF